MWKWDEFDPRRPLDLLLAGAVDRPGLHRENVFDFHDGLRLIVSDDQYAFGRFLHVSGSPRPPVLKKLYRQGQFDTAGLATLVHDRILYVGGVHVTLGFARVPPACPAWVVHCFDPPLPTGTVPVG